MSGNVLHRFLVIGVFLLLGLLLFNLFNIFGLKGEIESRLAEATRPAELELTTIEVDCDECFSIGEVVAGVKGSDVNITAETSLDSSSSEARALMEKYGIERLPAVVLEGETNRTSVQGFEQRDDALVFDSAAPPYVDAGTGEIVGRVSAIIIENKSCDVCVDFGPSLQNLKQGGVFLSEERLIYLGSAEAEQLVDKYGIKKVPALLLSTDIDAYPDVSQSLKQSGMQKRGDRYVIESGPPYIEAETGDLRGLVTLTMIIDESCLECYDVTAHKQVLNRYGLALEEEKTVDMGSAEGKELAGKYNITKAPTIILTGDVALYESFNSIWATVGTVEDDGAYVFRNMAAMGSGITYKDISTNETVTV